jgi:GntR family transcriptional repressor for pyruvate dehydrogenase complex
VSSAQTEAAAGLDPRDVTQVKEASVPPMRYPKASQIVAEKLRERIVRGTLKEGDVLPPEHELIAEFQVSRPTLREAIRILETEGLLTTSRGGKRGALVHYPGIEQVARTAALMLHVRGARISDVFQVFRMIEPAAARALAERAPLPDLSSLDRCVDAMEAAVGSPRETAQLLQRFSELLLELSGNPVLGFMGQALASIVERQLESIPLTTGQLPRSVASNMGSAARGLREVLTLIRKGDGDAAEAAMLQRMRRIEANHAMRVALSGADKPIL